MLDEGALRELETSAAHLAAEAGKILLQRFRQPLEVKYKAKGQRDPVTAADRASEEYLRQEITRRFPEHVIIAEETPGKGDGAPDVVWVVDPLDGTTNYLNGLPTFAVCIGVLAQGRPVVGAVFVPSVSDPCGTVLHARVGGGAYHGNTRVHVLPDDQPGGGHLSALPGSFGHTFRPGNELRRRPGEVRVTGSIAYELASVACGVFQYALIGRPRIWDVAGAVVLVREAGGEMLALPHGRQRWRPLDTFGPTGATPSLRHLRHWRAPIIAANPQLARYIAHHLKRRRDLLRRLPPHLAALLRRARGRHPEGTGPSQGDSTP